MRNTHQDVCATTCGHLDMSRTHGRHPTNEKREEEKECELGEVPCTRISSKRWMNILIIPPSTHHAAQAIICFPLHHGFNQVNQTQKGPQQHQAASRETLIRVRELHWGGKIPSL